MAIKQTIQHAADWLFKDKDGKVVIWQTPNWEIIAWAFFTLLAAINHSHNLKLVFGIAAFVALAVWALREIFQGASNFRRFLGAAILIFSIISKLR